VFSVTVCNKINNIDLINQSNQSNYWFNVHTFIGEDDSDAQKKNRLAAECSRKKFSLKQLFKANG